MIIVNDVYVEVCKPNVSYSECPNTFTSQCMLHVHLYEYDYVISVVRCFICQKAVGR